jgi:ASC-1-like (ASCH) protein
MSNLDHNLNQINGKINRWHAVEHTILALAGILTAWVTLTALDVWLRPRFYGRIALSVALMLLCVTALVWLARVLRRTRTPAAVAAFLEKKFPQLDNHLINRVLFANETSQSSWLKTYLNEGVPGFDTLPLAEIKNKKLRQRGAGAVAAALLALAVPAFVLGNAWTIALQRVANPFSRLAPPTFATVVAVQPENKTIVQGDGINLVVKATGRAGQFIDLDLYPSDDKRSSIRVGQFKATGTEEEFVYRVSKISTSLGYRFKVGDAYPTDTYTVDTVPPLALTSLRLKVTPPGYTALAPRTFDALTNSVTIPAHSEVTFQAVCNRAVISSAVAFEKSDFTLSPTADKASWSGSVVISEGGLFQVTAKDALGLEMRIPIRYELLEDRSPTIRLITPSASRAVLPPNAIPALQFETSDDYGLGVVRLERVKKGAKPTAEGEVLKEWDMKGFKSYNVTWNGKIEDVDTTSALRIVAVDNADGTVPNRAVSPLIVFEMTTVSSMLKGENQQRADARKTLGELVARQRAALGVTTRLQAGLPTFDEQPWKEVADKQSEIRSYANTLLKTKDVAVGSARVALDKALQGPLPEAAFSLARMTSGEAEKRGENAKRAVEAQNTVLRLLGQAEDSMGKGEMSKAAAGVLAMLEGIRKGQAENLKVTLKSVQTTTPMPTAIIDRQDNLAQDMEAMIGFCNSEAKQDRDDEEFGKLMVKIAAKAGELKLHPTMVNIAEVMESEKFAESVPPQNSVTNGIATLMEFLREWRETDTKEKTEDALAVIKDARQSVKKMEDLQTRVVDALRETGSQGDKTQKLDEDLLEEIAELKANMAQAMLKTATDLQALPELDAVNELVTDTFQTYEEMKQEEGSGTNAVTELGLQKEDFLLDLLAKTGQKADEMEMWLMAKADAVKRNTEQIDKEEMKAPIGQVTMPEELQDIIGDLMEQEEEKERQADDSTTNQGDANPDSGWGIAEGEFTSFNASGKSGNERPEHKDQDGRSQVGRAGMSDGEVMARSGKVNAGDKNIDKRRTQDSSQSGDVEEEGHSDAVATGGGKNSGYSQEKGMEGGEGATRRDTKVDSASAESTRAQLTRNAEAVYGQAQLNNLRTYDLKKYIAFSKQLETLQKQNASPAMIAELHKKALQALSTTYASLESGIGASDMGATSNTDMGAEAVAASPDEAPAEYRDMVSDYFKAIGEMN